MERQEVHQQLEQIRQRRDEGRRLDAQLAHEEAALVAMLGRELDGDTPADQAAVHESAVAAQEALYGPLRSAADLPGVLHAWRLRIPGARALWHRVDASSDRIRGDAGAPVVVVEYGDYQCVECAEATALQPRASDWVEAGRLCFVWRHFPLIDAHPFALRAAQAVEAAAAQGRFWEMHDELLRYRIVTDDDHQEHVQILTAGNDKALEGAARRAGLDLDRFRSAIDEPAAVERILDDVRGGLASGVNGTPTFFVNGERAEIIGPDELFTMVSKAVAASAEA